MAKDNRKTPGRRDFDGDRVGLGEDELKQQRLGELPNESPFDLAAPR